MKIGIIGFGNMGSAIAQRLKGAYRIFVFDKDAAKTMNLSSAIEAAKSSADLVKQADVVILAVKPQDFDGLLKEIKPYLDSDKLIISIAAGIPTLHIEEALGIKKIIRAMPSIGAKIGESVTCLCPAKFAGGGCLALTEEIFKHLGDTRRIDEGLMNAATAIAGSGPAYIFYYIESHALDPKNISEAVKKEMEKRLQSAAKKVGFTSDDALFLATSTTASSIDLLSETALSAEQLRIQVASKGGTTEAALKVLQGQDKDNFWDEAALAALRRAEELAKRE